MLPDWVLEVFDDLFLLVSSGLRENPCAFILGVATGMRVSKWESTEVIDTNPLFLLAESILPYIAIPAYIITGLIVIDFVRRLYKTHQQWKQDQEREREKEGGKAEEVKELREKYALIGNSMWMFHHSAELSWEAMSSDQRVKITEVGFLVEDLKAKGLLQNHFVLDEENSRDIPHELSLIVKYSGVEAVREYVKEQNAGSWEKHYSYYLSRQ